MTFAIADASDHILDSAVFRGAGSFSPDVPEPSAMTLLGFGLGLLGLLRRQRKQN
jgi:PEP-CTERM motif